MADAVARAERDKIKKKASQIKKTGAGFEVGMWVEALKKNKRPYLMAKVLKATKDNYLDLEFEDGVVERRISPRNERVKVSEKASTGATARR